jgi:hypothetical protein
MVKKIDFKTIRTEGTFGEPMRLAYLVLIDDTSKVVKITRTVLTSEHRRYSKNGWKKKYKRSFNGRYVMENVTTLQVSHLQLVAFNVSLSLTDSKEKQEPYFGWCEVEGCEQEGANGGGCWRDTGYWTVCSKHSQEYREGKPQPPMKQWAIDREKSRGSDGVLVNEG